ncbi:MAG TPA: cytochrome C [Burkholderiales bacterium]|nr:cytochrome C [Burkholderiales bacterium]
MQQKRLGGIVAALALSAGAILLAPTSAQAVPSFARQTGMACEACHTVFPELTPFGRRFKLNAYTIDNLPQVSGITQNKDQTLLLNQLPPLSFMFQMSYTSTKAAVPDSCAGSTDLACGGGTVPADALAKNGQVLFPQQASLFYAGRIAPNLGAFVQMTYDGTTASFGWDNTDIRYARLWSDNFLWGISFNNNPTVQDVWNSTPAWQSPFDQRSATAPAPGAATMIDGGLADAGVAGLSVYGWWNNSVYAELGLYHSAPAAAQIDSTSTNVVNGWAPYWRIAYEHQWARNSWEVGAYGVDTKIFPGSVDPTNGIVLPLSGPTNHFRDWAVDSQYQFIGDEHLLTVTATYIDEHQTLDAFFNNPLLAAPLSSNSSNTLKTTRIGASYYYQRKYGAALGYFSTTGSEDDTLYAPGALTGYANGKPDSNGWTGELNWVPYQNTKIALQYTWYTKYNGASTNYDGNNRNASDNNTLYLLGWLNF